MAGAIAMTGNDTIVLNNRVLADLATGDCVKLEFPNDLANVETGKNGNSIFSQNESGRQVNVEIRVLRGSSDDRFLNGLLAQQNLNFAGFPLMVGQFIKKIGDGQGNIAPDTYNLSGGIFTKPVPAKTNTTGDVEQSLSIYSLRFANAPRTIG